MVVKSLLIRGPESNICMFTIATLGRADWSSWYELWEGAQAVLGMCLRFGREGTAIMRGKLR